MNLKDPSFTTTGFETQNKVSVTARPQKNNIFQFFLKILIIDLWLKHKETKESYVHMCSVVLLLSLGFEL